MSLPAQTVVQPQTIPNLSPQEVELDKLIRKKFDSLQAKGQPKFVLTRNYKTNNPAAYQQLKAKLKQYASTVTEEKAQSIDEFLPILMGNLEARPATVDPMLILTEEFGQQVEILNIDKIVRQRTKINKYGTEKKKNTTVRQCDKKTLESLSQFYDINAIKSHRKLCVSVKNYLKAYKKFTESMQKCTEAITSESQAYKNYFEFVKEQLDFNKVKPMLEQLSQTSMEEEQIEAKEQELDATPIKDRTNKNGAKKKDDTASTHKKKEGEQAKNEEKESQKQKNTRVRRSKEEVQRQRIKKQEEIQANRKQKEEKEKQKQMLKQKQKAEKAEKQRLKELERLAKQEERKAKQEEKEAKERQKQRQKQLKQQQRLAKEAEKKEKQKKNNPGQSITNWFKPKTVLLQNDSPSKTEGIQEKSQLKDNQMLVQNDSEAFLALIKHQSTPIQVCKQEFFHQKMKNENCKFQAFYTNIFCHRSRLQFTNFLVNEPRITDYTDPHFEIESGKYDDSSVEYEDLCGQMCNEDADELSPEEEEENEENSAIVPDNYLSGDEMSSGDESKEEIVVNIEQGGEWSFSHGMNTIARKFGMFCLYQDQQTPLSLNQTEQSNDLSVAIRCELYKEIHGFCGSKDILIKKLAIITDKVPKSYLDVLVKETTTKKGNQRLVKPEIIEFLNEQKEGFSKQLQDLKAKRDQQMMLEARGKVTQKEKEIQRLILQEAGTYYIIDLLQFLREKGYKMRKKDLTTFIDERVGLNWDDIRRRMKKMNLKEKQKLNQFLKKDKQKQAEKKPVQNQIISEKCDAEAENMIEEQKQEKQRQGDKQEAQNQELEKAKESEMKPQ